MVPTKFSSSNIFWHSFNPKWFSARKSFKTKIFVKFFFGPKIIFKHFVWTQNSFWPKICFGPKIYFGPRFVLDQKFFDPQIFWTQKFLDPKSFVDLKFLWTKNHFGPKIIFEPNICLWLGKFHWRPDLEKAASGASGACGHFVQNPAFMRTF